MTADPEIVRGARRIVLPGVGSFKACAEGPARDSRHWSKRMEERVLRAAACRSSASAWACSCSPTRGLEHGGDADGLGWIPGDVRAIERDRSGDQGAAYGLERCRRLRRIMTVPS